MKSFLITMYEIITWREIELYLFQFPRGFVISKHPKQINMLLHNT